MKLMARFEEDEREGFAEVAFMFKSASEEGALRTRMTAPTMTMVMLPQNKGAVPEGAWGIEELKGRREAESRALAMEMASE